MSLRCVLLSSVLISFASAARSADLPVDFDNDVQPVLTRFGCNSGPCHGKARGQGGFQLSLLGFDSDYDYAAIVQQGKGRRVFPADPDKSLLLMKPGGGIAHGGGVRLSTDGSAYAILRRWIAQGMPRRAPGAPTLQSVTVKPDSVVLSAGQTQNLAVTAGFSDGTVRDVTSLSAYQSNEAAIGQVNDTGLVTAGQITGTTAIMARYRGMIAVCAVTVPRPEAVAPEVYEKLPRNNFVDNHVWDRLQQLNITPSEVCSDTTFLRRATTHICGRIPRPDEVRAFLADSSPDKRERLIDRLLQEPDFADHWANKWMDLLRPNPYRVGIKTVMNYDWWIRDRFRRRVPWDQFVRELITASGSTWRNSGVTLFRDRRTPDEVATLVSQLFVGVRLECARCHHHPFEKWGQDDFYRFAAWFADVKHKGTGLSPPISGSEEFFFSGSGGTVRHPVTSDVMLPRPLWGTADLPEDASVDRRRILAQWLTSPQNHLFAQVMANRVWADMMGRGLVDPVDDFRATNPATNQPLLTALGRHFRDSQFSLTELVRVIAESHVYQLSSIPNANNAADTRNYSRHYRQRLRAEVLRDAFTLISGIQPKFAAMPPGTTARQIWTHRTASVFLDTFGRPDPNQDPPCERTGDSTVVQALHLMNAEDLHADLRNDNGNAARLAASDKSPAELADEIYCLIYGRPPTADESQFVVSLFEQPDADRRKTIEDLMWAMLNTPEFVFQD